MKRIVTLLLALPLIIGCVRGLPSEKTPIHVNPNMDDQPKYRPQERSEFFADGSTMRPPVPGTVARGELFDDEVYYYGKIDTTPVAKMPVPITMQLLRRGQERFNIYCSPCHGRTGDGQGIMIQRGYTPPPSFHDERVINFKDGYIFNVISHGIRNMPSYGAQVPVADRWAIIAYVRALQRSQTARIDDIPAQMRNQIK